MPIPHPGDVLIRSVATDRMSRVGFIDGPFDGLPAAAAAAHLRIVRAIWQQNVEARGHPLGEPFRLDPHTATLTSWLA